MIFLWLRGLLRTRTGRMLGTAAGIAVTVALLADLGAFIQSSGASMTARAVASISADWQVELVPGTTEATVVAAAKDAAAVRTIENVGYADVSGIEFKTGDTVQATGAGKAIGLNPSYSATFPQGFRMLAGDGSGAVLLQQTAANLHAAPGETVTIHRPGLPDATVAISGVLDLKTADTFFRAMGVPAGAAPQAPPDNAIFMPLADWHRLFDPQAQARPDSVRLQLHVAIDHAALPPDPNAAFAAATEAGHNFEARVAGSAILGNNLAAQLDAARGDSLFARVLFLFLGAPGVILAALLTFAVASSGADRRRRDQALLRLRGASPFMLLRFAIIEAAGVGVVGAATGMMLAAALLPAIRLNLFGPQIALWFGVAGLAGLLLAAAAIVVPAWHGSRTMSVAASRQTVESRPPPLWQRTYLDGICLALAGIVFWKTAASGYQIVLATEGVTSVSVDYTAFLAPLLLWVGAGLLTVRLGRLFLGHGRRVIEPLAAGLAGEVAPAVASSLSRQRHRVSAGIAFAALAIAFATSTALFNTTYQAQARVDAELTNGADVTVTGSTSAAPGSILDKLNAIPGVVDAQAMQHRYAYVGTDLQDLYGIDPNTIGQATTMSDAFFQNGQAKATLAELTRTPAGVLVSDETVNDFQLKQGDTLNLRLQDVNGTYKVIPFVFAGVVREFPTAPRDSFIVANADYVAKMTGVATRETVLMRTQSDMAAVKSAAIRLVAGMPGTRVTDLGDAVHLIGSSLTAVDLNGLTTLELAFAVAMAAGSTGLVLALGLADRRRGFAILAVLGANARVLSAFIWAEALAIVIGGFVFGVATGWLVAQILVVVLQGVFDPPPEALAVPWPYLAGVIVAVVIATALAVSNALRETRVEPILRLRDMQ